MEITVHSSSAILCEVRNPDKKRVKTQKVSAEKVNLNTATAEQLESLPGIGPVAAKNILEYRKKVGKFNRIEEIINVKGVGEKKFLKIKDRLTI